jgi:hypothetical protein
MNKRDVVNTCLLLLIFYNLAMNANATAVYTESINQIAVIKDPGHNMTWLYKQINNNSLLRHEGKVWYLNSTLALDDSPFYINNSDVDMLYLSNEVNGKAMGEGGLRNGDFRINNVKIKSWNWTLNREPDAFLGETQFHVICDNTGYIYNTIFEHIDRVNLNLVSNFNMTNIVVDNSFGGFSLYGAKSINMVNCTMKNFSSYRGIQVADSDNIHIKNAYVDVATGGVVFQHCSNSSMENVFTNNTGWMGVEADNGANNITFRNVTVMNNFHNALDLHGAYNVYVENMSIYNSSSNSIIITGSGNYENGGAWNITLKDVYTHKSGSNGDGILISTEVRDVDLINVTTELEHNGIEIMGVDGLNIANFTALSCNIGLLVSGLVKNTTVSDSNMSGSKDSSIYHWVDSIDYINILYDTIVLQNSANLTVYYYPDILVKDLNDKPVLNSTIRFENKTKSSFLKATKLNNKTVLAGLYKSASGFSENAYYYANITTPEGQTVSLSGITPDSSWYRKDPNIPTYTITAKIPDSSSKGPHIIGFAPSEKNLFNQGDIKNFRIWADENLTEMKWWVDGKLEAQNSLTYIWTVNKTVNNIEFTGKNSNGSVSQVWDFGEESKYPIMFEVLFNYAKTTQSPYPKWDVNKDGVVNIKDVKISQSNQGEN